MPASSSAFELAQAMLPVFAGDEHGTIVDSLVEDLLRERRWRAEDVCYRLAAEQPLARWLPLGVVADLSADGVDRCSRGEIELLERERAGHQVNVAVIQTGQHRGAMGVQHDRLRAAETLHFAVGAHAKDLVAADGNGFLELATAARIDLAVDDDQIDRAARVVTLRADDQPAMNVAPTMTMTRMVVRRVAIFEDYSVASSCVLGGGKDERAGQDGLGQ